MQRSTTANKLHNRFVNQIQIANRTSGGQKSRWATSGPGAATSAIDRPVQSSVPMADTRQAVPYPTMMLSAPSRHHQSRLSEIAAKHMLWQNCIIDTMRNLRSAANKA